MTNGLRWAAATWIAASLAVAMPPARADRLHLESGGQIDVSAWWIEGDWLKYDSDSGTVGIPRSSVVRIEPGESAADESVPAIQAPDGTGRPKMESDPAEIEQDLRRARQALEDRDFETASSYFLDLIREEDSLQVARVGYAVSEIALGRDGLALSAVLDGLVVDPEHPDLLELLGDLRYRDERTEDALRHWRAARAVRPGDRIQQKIEKGERELGASRNYDFAASPHFNLRYDGDVDLDLAAAVMDHLENQYWELTGAFRHSPVQPITVQLFPTREFREVTQSPEWVGGLYDGKIRVPLGGLRNLNARAERVLVHELTHAIVHSKTRGNCSRWLHEGLAQRSEGKSVTRAQSQKLMERLAEPEPVDLDGEDFSYPAALSLTTYLEERGSFDDLVYLLDLLGDGRGLDDALEHVFGEDLASVSSAWARTVREEAAR